MNTIIPTIDTHANIRKSMIIPLGASRENIEGRVEIQGQSEDGEKML